MAVRQLTHMLPVLIIVQKHISVSAKSVAENSPPHNRNWIIFVWIIRNQTLAWSWVVRLHYSNVARPSVVAEIKCLNQRFVYVPFPATLNHTALLARYCIWLLLTMMHCIVFKSYNTIICYTSSLISKWSYYITLDLSIFLSKYYFYGKELTFKHCLSSSQLALSSIWWIESPCLKSNMKPIVYPSKENAQKSVGDSREQFRDHWFVLSLHQLLKRT